MSEHLTIQHNFNRFAYSYNEHAVVQREIAKRLFKRLEFIKSSPKAILELGAGTGIFTHELLNAFSNEVVFATDFAPDSLVQNPAIHTSVQDAHALSLPHTFPATYDAVVSNLMMQWCDTQRICDSLQHITGEGSLVLFSSFGPLTLHELKESWENVDDVVHVRTFEDMHTTADILSSAGFEGVVAESELITLTYQEVRDMLLDIKHIGAQNSSPTLTTKSKLGEMIREYETFRTNGKLPLTYEVVYIHGWRKKSTHSADIALENT